jgi:FAD/FMN-containing dehydrogenase
MTAITRYTGGISKLAPVLVEKFRTQLRGELILPGNTNYDQARTVWNAAIDKRPAMIARCADASDVIESVKFARRHNILISVRCGGHNIAGKAVAENGLMIDLTPMCDVRVGFRADAGISTGRVIGSVALVWPLCQPILAG